jgi:pimeloyl-ACP methyl ester carboxylesterase
MKARLVFLHGLESGPHGSKYQALRNLDPELISPDCRGISDIGERLAIIEEALAGVEKMVIVGSSFGGLAAVLFAQKPTNFSRIKGCLLCAPALPRISQDEIASIPLETVILHGTRDEVVPLQSSKDFSERHGIRLVEVYDDHRLSASPDIMVTLTAGLLSGSGEVQESDPD